MNKNKITYVLGAVVAFVFFAITSPTFATVGGPSFIYDLSYNPIDSSVYFLQRYDSGRGCPPVLDKISMLTDTITNVITCDMAENLNPGELETEINAVTADFKDVTMFSLPRNSITFDISPVGTEIISDGRVLKTNFLVNVYQDGKKIDQFSTTGCDTKQPFAFGGYLTRGITKKFILVLSTKGDCFEGGYSRDSINIIDGITIKDKTLYNDVKITKPLVKNEATVVAYVRNQDAKNPIIPTPQYTPEPTVTSPKDSTDNSVHITTALIAGSFLILGVGLGYVVKK